MAITLGILAIPPFLLAQAALVLPATPPSIARFDKDLIEQARPGQASPRLARAEVEAPGPAARGEPGRSAGPAFVVFGQGAPTGSRHLVRAADGLFYLDALVNGVPVRFLVDTGSTSVVLTAGDARRAGIPVDFAGSSQRAQTAGGEVATTRVKLARLVAGPSASAGVDAVVADSPGVGVSLLGQSWLGQFASVTITRDQMVFD